MVHGRSCCCSPRQKCIYMIDMVDTATRSSPVCVRSLRMMQLQPRCRRQDVDRQSLYRTLPDTGVLEGGADGQDAIKHWPDPVQATPTVTSWRPYLQRHATRAFCLSKPAAVHHSTLHYALVWLWLAIATYFLRASVFLPPHSLVFFSLPFLFLRKSSTSSPPWFHSLSPLQHQHGPPTHMAARAATGRRCWSRRCSCNSRAHDCPSKGG